MASSKQANKRIRTNEKAKERNKTRKGAMRTAEKKVHRADGADALASLPDALRKIDKAAKQGVIHKNAAARRKSRLTKAANAAAAGA